MVKSEYTTCMNCEHDTDCYEEVPKYWVCEKCFHDPDVQDYIQRCKRAKLMGVP